MVKETVFAVTGLQGWDIWSFVELELGAVQYPLELLFLLHPALGSRTK